MRDVVVLGSMNMDVTVRVPELPAPGETVLGDDAEYGCGGKGGNQAAAAARLLGARGRVRMVGLVGDDEHGRRLVADLAEHGVDVDQVRALPDVGTGMAMICVDDHGENTIVVSPGANAAWQPHHLDDLDLGPGDVLLVQLEVPVVTVAEAVHLAAARGARVVLNAAPPQDVPASLLAELSVLVLNETEAAHLLGRAPQTTAHLEDLAAPLACGVVVTLGARGALVRPPGSPAVHVPAVPVEAVSAVGAGDAFVGALAVALLDGAELVPAVRRGCAAGALATTAPGARGALPTPAALESLLGGVPC